ncbi:MAG: hypothetical protein LBB23_04890 [Rickettsiales bacterium]|jgi:hypothetical protein|nr:hypothetical protein [Rickettsiales bacterium]
MIFDLNNLYAKTCLLPTQRANNVFLENKFSDGAAFFAQNSLFIRLKHWECVDHAAIQPAALYLKMLSSGNYPQPESDFLKRFSDIPDFIWPELIAETLQPRDILEIIEWHAKTIRSIIEFLIIALPADKQATACQLAFNVRPFAIDPNSEHFDALWHSTTDEAREVLREALPDAKQASDPLFGLDSVPLNKLDFEILSRQADISDSDCDDIIELALLRLSQSDNFKHRLIEFGKKHRWLMGGASDERLESLMCMLAATKHPKQSRTIKKHLSAQFPAKDPSVLMDAPGKLVKIATDNLGLSEEWDELKKLFRQVAVACPENASLSELILLFRIYVVQHQFSIMQHKEVPVILSKSPDISEEFAWEFRCEYGASVLGLLEPVEPKGDFGAPELKPDLIDISQKKPAAVFASLYNYAWPQGQGFLQYMGIPMKECDAARIMARQEENTPFSYVAGRAMHLNISKDSTEINIVGYDKDNGCGVAQRAIRAVPNTRQR